MSEETHVQRAFQATAALFRALGVSQDTASRELGLRGHTSFSFWKTGEKEFEGRYARALYLLVSESVNRHWPARIDDQMYVTDKLLAVFDAWELACQQWRKDIHDAWQRLQRTATRTQQFGDPNAPGYAQEFQHITQEISQLNESLSRIGEFEAAWERGRIQIQQAIQDARQRHEATKAAQPPAKPKSLKRPARRKGHRRARV
jgi:hypothetical protein